MIPEQRINELAFNFLLDCALGQHSDLITAAIDKAYVDMAAHTLKIFSGDYEEKWKCRFKATKLIKGALVEYSSDEKTFEEWHKSTIDGIKREYSDRLSDGQAQKWLNMTIKYLFVIKISLGEDDERLKPLAKFISKTNEQDYYPPIDSFVLKGAGITVNKPWSALDCNEYEKIMKTLREGHDFIWELESWGEFAEQYKEYAKDSYARYVRDNIYEDEQRKC